MHISLFHTKPFRDITYCGRFINKSYWSLSFPTGAIDCTHVQIQSPGGPDAEIYRNRKGVFSINVQAVADPKRKFLSIVARWFGSAHDSRVFDNSWLRSQLESWALPGHLLGDAGYPNLPFLMTPIRNPTSQPEQRFNNALSTTRMPVECMFGMWKRRFACLTQKLRTKLTTSLTIIVACAVLHNIAIGHSDLEDDTPIIN